ncbi:MAG: hypothetical protein ABI165_19720 [Bryobacteraceae bacterium]
MKPLSVSVCGLIVASVLTSAHAGTILGTTYTDTVGNLLVSNGCCFVEQQIQINQTTQVSAIDLGLAGNGADPFNFYLTDAIGSIANANSVLYQASGAFPNGFSGTITTLTPAQTLSLQPGTYYLVLATTVQDLNGPDGWDYVGSLNDVLPSSVVSIHGVGDTQTRAASSFPNVQSPWESNFFPVVGGAFTPPAFEFDLQSPSSTATPEPASWLLGGVGLIGLLLIQRPRFSCR